MDKKIFKDIEVKALEEGCIECIMTGKNTDREGEVVLPEGVDYKEFLALGTVLFNHNQDLPIGTATKVWKSKDVLKAHIKFAVNDPFSQKIYNLIKEGVIKAVSIGFQAIEDRLPTKKDLQDYGKECRRIISKIKLFELSVVSVPANAEALITNVKSLQDKFELTDDDIQIIFGKKTIDLKNIEIDQKQMPNIDIQIKKDIKKDYNIEIAIKKATGTLLL